MLGFMHETVDLGLGQSIHLTQLAQDAAGAKGAHGPHQCRMSCLITVKDIIVHLVALIPAKVHIKIRRTLALGIEKTLKGKFECYGVNIGDP